MPKPMRLSPAMIPLWLLAACSTSQLPLVYAPTGDLSARGPAVAAAVSARDGRDEAASDANWFGAIRGGLGNPLKRLETDRPLPDVVANAVRDGLRARGLLGHDAAPYEVRVAIEQLEADQVARREAQVRLRLSWIRRSDGQPAFVNQGRVDLVEGSVLTLQAGVFGSVDSLRALTARALSQAIDQALDDPALAAFLSASPLFRQHVERHHAGDVTALEMP